MALGSGNTARQRSRGIGRNCVKYSLEGDGQTSEVVGATMGGTIQLEHWAKKLFSFFAF